MKSTILSEKDHKLIEQTILKYGRIVQIADLMNIFSKEYSTASAHNRIHFLAKAGWFKRLKQGLYLVIDSLTARAQTDISLLQIANVFVQESYVSLAHALNYYQLFDQHSTTIVSVSATPSKRYFFDQPTFMYAKVKAAVYFGFTAQSVAGQRLRVAEAEKALLDYLYLDTSFLSASVVFETVRDHQHDLDLQKLQDYAQRFGITMTRKVGWLFDQVQLDSTTLYRSLRQNRSVAHFTPQANVFNAKWRIYYDDRISG
jgi:predicted transcriptional regulator of viral defense system